MKGPLPKPARHFYSFGTCRFYVTERELSRGGEPVALTPKTLDTLLLLLRRSGHVVDKDELMSSLWPDAFVEEDNLVQQISHLRKALGERPDGGPYIETAARRGYRFAAPVTESWEEEPDSGKLAGIPATKRKRPWRWLWAVVLVTLAVLAAFVLYRWLAPRPAAPYVRMEIIRLTDSGKASAAAISPDGKYVVHAVPDKGMTSLWMRNVATGSNVQIMPPAEGSFSDLSFSRDGNSLYYLFNLSTLYSMPVLGGSLRKLASVGGGEGASFSPDEKRLAFARRRGEDSHLIVVNVDGSGERQLASRKYPDTLEIAAWSPDGKIIASAVRSFRDGIFWSLEAIPEEGGPGKRIGSRTWDSMAWDSSRLRWLPDGRGLILIAGDLTSPSQVWFISYPEGEARRITNDLNSYSGLSLTGDAGALVTVQSESTSRIWVVSIGDAASAREITAGRIDGAEGVSWAGDGNIVFSAPDSKQQPHFWIAAADGTGRRQITSEGPFDRFPAVCGNGRHLVYTSHRAAAPHIWRSDLDGGNARQLSNGNGEFWPSCSPDGTWLTYGDETPGSWGVWRMPINGGAPVRIWDQYGVSRISPDGKWIVVREWFAAEPKVQVIPAAGGPPTRTFDLSELGWGYYAEWSADGTALLYVRTSGGGSNVWRQPLDGSEPKQVTNFTSDQFINFAVSRDGKRLALARGSTTSDVVLIKDLK